MPFVTLRCIVEVCFFGSAARFVCQTFERLAKGASEAGQAEHSKLSVQELSDGLSEQTPYAIPQRWVLHY